MISLRKTRIINFVILILLIVFIFNFYYITQHNVVAKLKNIINLENERLHSWLIISQLANKAKEDFYQIILERKSDISDVILSLQLWDKELERLKNSPYVIDRDNAAYLKRAERRFKSSLFGHKREIESGYYGTTALEMDNIALSAVNQILVLADRAGKDVFNLVNQRAENIIQEFEKSNNILIFTFIIVLILALALIFMLGLTINRALKMFITGMQHLSNGEFDYRIRGKFDKDIQELAGVFNKMADNLKKSGEKVNKAYKVLGKVTGNINEGIMLLSKDLKILWANKKIGEVFGRKDPEIIGKYCYNIIHNSEQPCAEQDKCPFKKMNESGLSSATVQTLYDHKGVSFYAECILFSLIDVVGEVNEYIYIIRDINERIVLEQRMESNILALLTARMELEKRMKDLEKIHTVTINRELRMVELKKRLVELESAANKQGGK